MKKHKKRKLYKIRRIVISNIQLFIISVSIIMIWRGIWNFLDEYFVADYFFFSNFFSIILGIIILFLNNFDLEEVR
ncbi:MAG: hypothetical protein H6767_01535 [Candidatus Peribacteria bacterium]|nr:MAG: hypothetical protein H6767_01535 [Candidatus Peribacteria bacterium]